MTTENYVSPEIKKLRILPRLCDFLLFDYYILQYEQTSIYEQFITTR